MAVTVGALLVSIHQDGKLQAPRSPLELCWTLHALWSLFNIAQAMPDSAVRVDYDHLRDLRVQSDHGNGQAANGLYPVLSPCFCTKHAATRRPEVHLATQ
jgi:hypothetical protein